MTHDEYLTNIAIPFREFLAAHGDVDEYLGGWVSVEADVICHNAECSRNGETIRMSLPEQFNGIYSAFCGMCSDANGFNTLYTDITFWGYQGEAFTS